MKLIHAAWLALSFLAAGAAFAQAPDRPGKFYVGLQVGQSELDRDGSNITGDFDDHDVAYNALFGFRFSRFYALEFGYSDLGEFSADFASGDTGSTALKIFTINNVIVWPIDEHFHLKALLGANYYELSASLDYMSSGTRTSFSDKGGSYNAGLGIGVPINQHLELGLDVTLYRAMRFEFVEISEIDLVYETDATVVTLGARYRF